MQPPPEAKSRSRSRRTPSERAVTKLVDLASQRRASPVVSGRILAILSGADREAAAKAAGLSRRSAYYLVTIAQAVDAGLMAEEDFVRLGWARARVLASQALRTGRKISRAAIQHALAVPARAVAAGPSSPKAKSVSLDFVLTPAQAKTVRQALALHGAPPSAGPKARAAALATICAGAASPVGARGLQSRST